MQDILDFGLNVQQHENLCRACLKDIRKSGRTVREDWPEYWDYARRHGSIYGTVVGMGGGSTAPAETKMKMSCASTAELLVGAQEAREEAHLLEEDPRVASVSQNAHTADGSDFKHAHSITPFTLTGGQSPTLFARRASRAPTVIPRNGAISCQDLIKSAEYIYFRYLAPSTSPGKESHEIYLPPTLQINSFLLSGETEPRGGNEGSMMAQVLDMFHAQKEYVFRAMEQDAFPRILRAKASGKNLTPVSALVRLVAGLVLLWIALAASFALVFLDVKPKSKRFLFVPFGLAFLALVSHQYKFDPVLVFLNRSESTPFRTLAVRELYVRKFLLGRAV